MLDGQVIIGRSQSLTVTVKLQRPWLLAPSVAVQFTVVVPRGKLDPEAGEQLTVGACCAEQLSEALTVYVTFEEHCPGALHTVILAGQLMVGLSQSLTVTAKLHWLWLLAPSVAVQLTVVVPIAKLDPEAGEQLTVGAC
jgi:hypothetical protein